MILCVTILHLAFSPRSPPRFLGHPAAKILYAYNPSRESEVVVNSVFTAAGHFHVPPVRCSVSVSGLFGLQLFHFLLCLPFSCYPSSFLCAFALAFIFSVQIRKFGGS